MNRCSTFLTIISAISAGIFTFTFCTGKDTLPETVDWIKSIFINGTAQVEGISGGKTTNGTIQGQEPANVASGVQTDEAAQNPGPISKNANQHIKRTNDIKQNAEFVHAANRWGTSKTAKNPEFFNKNANQYIRISDVEWGAGDNHDYIQIKYLIITDNAPKRIPIHMDCLAGDMVTRETLDLYLIDSVSKGSSGSQIFALPKECDNAKLFFRSSDKGDAE